MSHYSAMEPIALLNTAFDCDCGKKHFVPIREILYSEDAVRRLPNLCERLQSGDSIVVVADNRTYTAAGRDVERTLAAVRGQVRVCLLPDSEHGDPVCDDITKMELCRRIGKPPDLLVAVGSGVINDLCKWLAMDFSIPYLVVATAASMNGYSSCNIAPSIKGVKRVISGVAPLAIVAVPSVISSAPYKLTAAGLGDALAKPVSTTDWKINHVLFNEYYCPLCADLINEIEPGYLNNPMGIRAGEPTAVKALFMALLYSGIAMTIADTSFPASGGEHLISHVLDMTANRDRLAHDYHGRQVGLGTIFACALYERMLNVASSEFRLRVEETDRDYWTSLTTVVEEEHERKRARAALAVKRLTEPGVWESIREIIEARTLGAATVKRCLKDAGAAHSLADIGCSRERFADAVLHCHQIRERYTIIDLARAAGIIPAQVNDIIAEYLSP